MIILCLKDLVPFLVSYILFLIIFTICFIVLQMEVSQDMEKAEGLKFFELMFLQTFMTSIGELFLPKYTEVYTSNDSPLKSIQITLIWLSWFFSTFLMLVFMLNFLIAVISSTYERVINYEKVISYIHKADLNQEYYSLASFFADPPEYKVIVFSETV